MSETYGEEPLAGFNIPITPQDPWVAGQYEVNGLGEAPSLADIEPVALRMLDDLSTSQTALELVLGRRVDSAEMLDDSRLRPLMGIFMSGASAEDKFAALLLTKASLESEQDS